MKFRLLVSIATLFLPWPVRRLVLVHALGYSIDKSARVGFSAVCPMRLEMGPGSRIGHLSFCKPAVELLRLEEGASVGNWNWIGAVSRGSKSHFRDQVDLRSELIVKEHSSITNRHYVDCTATVSIGRFTTFAGVRSIILSHSIDLNSCKQTAKPVSIGEFCFVGTSAVVLSGAILPDYSVLGANSLLNKQYDERYCLYAGNPARLVKRLSQEAKYFTRAVGFVD